MEFLIRLNTMEDAVKLVNRLEKYDCRADAHIDRLVIDARSLMAWIGFGIGKEILIIVHSDLDERLSSELDEFLVA